MRFICFLFILIINVSTIISQEINRGSIPDELLRPKRGEPSFYPIDTVIGKLGRGDASNEAYTFAKSAVEGFLIANVNHPAFKSIDAKLITNYFEILEIIKPVSYRIGGGKEEVDGAFSFLLRFVGAEKSVIGELFIRDKSRQKNEKVDIINDGETTEETKTIIVREWVFEDLILEEARNIADEQKESTQRFDFSPYERFF